METQWFEWDEVKAQKNFVSHGISFTEAQVVFNDPLAAIDDDRRHSIEEKREVIIGHDRLHRLLWFGLRKGQEQFASSGHV